MFTFIVACNIYVACTMTIEDMYDEFVREYPTVLRVFPNIFYALAWIIRLIKDRKRMVLVKQLNQFYACISTVDHTYNDYVVTLADLYDDNEVSSILYDIEDNYFIYDGAYDLYRRLEEVR